MTLKMKYSIGSAASLILGDATLAGEPSQN